MNNRTYYNEILTEHNADPLHKHMIANPSKMLRGVNPSCGDDITLLINTDENGMITEGSYVGDGCAISQASADIMIDMIIGKSVDEALKLKDKFIKMIHGEASEDEIESLEEASALRDISHMPSRVKCAVLSWHTLEEMYKDK